MFSGLLFVVMFIILPIILCIRNCYFAFNYPKMTFAERSLHKYANVSERRNDLAVIIFGTFCACVWIGTAVCGLQVSSVDYDQATYIGYKHNFLHSEYGVTVYITLFIAFAALVVLAAVNPEKLPPIPQALCFGFTVIGIGVFIFLTIQLWSNSAILILPLVFYIANIIIVTEKLTRRYIQVHLEYKQEHAISYRFLFAERLEEKLVDISSMKSLEFMMILPAAVLLIMLYVLFGQGPDGIVKAFTMTADWTFSTQTPPPPIDYNGHYLCTVAAGGHEKVVKPLRYGKRRGDIIVVNRQLLASNAFEDMIMEKAPRFHRAVRRFYDKHGYPISRHITTRTRADIVYFIMKPLEWLFILCLYTFDTHPENRIAVQYSDYKKVSSK